MKKIITICLILQSFFCLGQSISWSPFKILPIGLRLSPAGLAISVAKTLVSKRLGKFSISTGYNLYRRNNTSSPSYSSNGYNSTYSSSSNSFIVEDNDFTLIIRYKDEDHVYTIADYDEIEVYTDGKTLFKAGKEKIIIDVTNSNLDKIEFRGKEFRGERNKMLTELEKEIGRVGFKDYIEAGNFNSKGQALVSLRVNNKINFAIINNAFEVVMLLPYANIICQDGKTLHSNYNTMSSYAKMFSSYGSINKSCTIDFDSNCGLLPVSDGTKWGFIDKNNNSILPFIYDDATNFNSINCISTINMKNNTYKINKQGKVIY